METTAPPDDPVLEFINDAGGLDPSDDFLMHMISLTDVVKNDMKKALSWSEAVINQRLHALIEIGLDDNFRYRIRPDGKNKNPDRKFSFLYTEAQCLLTEWLGLYRMIRIYTTMKQGKRAA